ncbi:DUF6221 family protein [Streptomyces sp. NPDC012510]|uniref:DUF6221 family protein n=1 Tax=Streptomyces sp. NPDC012510 TaxID=3364838 RepID=UPI0036E72405
MPGLHGWITQQIDRVEVLARAATRGPWITADHDDQVGMLEVRTVHEADIMIGYVADVATADAHHIALHDPVAVLRRCAADRKILARHRLDPNAFWADAAMCEGCGTEGEMGYPRTENLNDCPELLDLAEAHGITPEILATLDRPQEGERPEPPGPSLIPDAIVEGMYGQLWAHVIGTRPIEPRPEVKAMKILGPELKKIPGYVPTTEEQP